MSFQGWVDILHEAADEVRAWKDAPPEACPNDGEPLEEGPDGTLHCRFDGFRWPS